MSNALMTETFKAFEARLLGSTPKPPSRAMRMTFGKHLGVPLDQVPRGYLRWVMANVKGVEATLADAIDRAIQGEPIPEELPAGDFGD